MPEISIIIPILNSASTLNKCLESVRSQTFSDWEAICVYDNSDDNSMEIIQSFVIKDSRFIFIQGRNKLLAGARNDGIKKSKGKYIFFLDSDDSLASNAFERCVKEFQKHNCDIVIFGTDIVPKNPRASNWHYMVLSTPNKFYKQFSTKALFGEDSARPFVWRNAYTKEFLDRCGVLFDETCAVGEDQVFQICAFPHAEKGIVFIKDKLYQYTWNRNGSLMCNYDQNLLFKYTGHIKMVNSIFNYWENCNYNKISKKDLVLWALFFLETDLDKLSLIEKECLENEINMLFCEYFNDYLIEKFPFFIKLLAERIKNLAKNKKSRLFSYISLSYRQVYYGGILSLPFYYLKYTKIHIKRIVYEKTV